MLFRSTPSDDGYVHLTFANGNASCTPVDGKVDASQGKGEISINLPAGCGGTNVVMTAELRDGADQPLQPAVAQAITANIQ